MKTILFKRNLFSGIFGCLLSLSVVFGFNSCTETIDESNFAIKTEQTVIDYLVDNPDRFSGIKTLFDRVQLGNGSDASKLSSVLGARGNYTVFAPNNEALDAYVKALGANSVDELNDEQAELIAKSCIIDNGDLSAYEEADFPASGAFDVSNLNDRIIQCMQDTIDANGGYIINGNAKVVRPNIEVSNGMIHEVGSVIAPSSDNLYEMIAAAGNLDVFAHLLELTSWADSLSAEDYIDAEYEAGERDEEWIPTPGTLSKSEVCQIPAHRYRGYTAFVEKDEVFASEWGINLTRNAEGVVTNWDEVMAVIKQKCEAAFGSVDADDLKSPDNAINRFVAYHLIEGRLSYLNLVHHYNEFGYKYKDRARPQIIECPTNVWDYFTTRGKYRGLLKVTQVGDNGFEQDKDHKMYINRKSIYDNGRKGDYKELGYEVRGALISPDNGEIDNNALNGFYFPVDRVLLYDDATRTQLASERIRIDLSTMFPELLSYGVRGGKYTYFPRGYINNIVDQSESTIILYLNPGVNESNGGYYWRNYQGDEMNAFGLFDFTFRLPPFPKDGTYEIRLGCANQSGRAMAQLYFGTNPNALKPTGLPVDMRIQAGDITIPWEADIDGADEINAENDKKMRNQGYMKGPNYFYATGTETPVRQIGGGSAALRLIVTTDEMKADETYYIRFKTALNTSNPQQFLDYFEYVPTSVYNGTTEEDIW